MSFREVVDISSDDDDARYPIVKFVNLEKKFQPEKLHSKNRQFGQQNSVIETQSSACASAYAFSLGPAPLNRQFWKFGTYSDKWHSATTTQTGQTIRDEFPEYECPVRTKLDSRIKRRKLVQKTYSCKYCLRTFNSAQAVGGHLKVHIHQRSVALTSPSSFMSHKHHNYNPRHLHDRHAHSGMSSSSLLPSPLPAIPTTSLGILVRSNSEVKAVSSVLPLSSRGCSHLYLNPKQHPLWQPSEVSDYAGWTYWGEGHVSTYCYAVSQLLLGTTTLDLSLKLGTSATSHDLSLNLETSTTTLDLSLKL